MKIGDRGLSLIKEFESLRLEAYQDETGLWTIGWGHTKTAKPGMRITLNQAEALLKTDCAVAERAINRQITKQVLTLTQNQFDALVSFVFNTGAFSNTTLLLRLAAGDYAGAADQFPRWDKVTVDGNKVRSKGLTRRRAREMRLFLTV